MTMFRQESTIGQVPWLGSSGVSANDELVERMERASRSWLDCSAALGTSSLTFLRERIRDDLHTSLCLASCKEPVEMLAVQDAWAMRLADDYTRQCLALMDIGWSHLAACLPSAGRKSPAVSVKQQAEPGDRPGASARAA